MSADDVIRGIGDAPPVVFRGSMLDFVYRSSQTWRENRHEGLIYPHNGLSTYIGGPLEKNVGVFGMVSSITNVSYVGQHR